jgi:hypothetical protein
MTSLIETGLLMVIVTAVADRDFKAVEDNVRLLAKECGMDDYAERVLAQRDR